MKRHWRGAIVSLVILAALISGLVIYLDTETGGETKEALLSCVIGDETHRVEAFYPFPLWNGTNNVVYISEKKVNTLKIVEQETGVRWEDLMSMCVQESTTCAENTIGDGGMSFGAFQIHSYWNPITDEMKGSFELQARWTAINLRSNGYKQNRMWAIQMHNTSNDYSMRYAKAVYGRALQIKNQNE